MAWESALEETSFQVHIGPQPDGLNVVATAWTSVYCEMPQIDYDTSQSETKRSRKQRGAGTRRKTGKRWVKVALRFPDHGQAIDYDPTSGTPQNEGLRFFVDYLGGVVHLGYQNNGVEPSTGQVVSLVTSVGRHGCLLIAGASTDDVVTGWISTWTGSGPWPTTLFEDLPREPAASSKRYPSRNVVPQVGGGMPHSIRVVGETGRMWTSIGCVPTAAKRTLDDDGCWYWNVELTAYGGEEREDGGAWSPIEEFQPLPEMLERGGGRYVIGSNVLPDLANGEVDPDGTCDVRGLELAITFPHYMVPCPASPQGVKAIVVKAPTITATFSLPDIEDFEVDGRHILVAAWEDETDVSVSCYCGKAVGAIDAWCIRRGNLTAFPKPTFVDGLRHLQVTVEAVDYTGDGSTEDAGNVPFVYSNG